MQVPMEVNSTVRSKAQPCPPKIEETKDKVISSNDSTESVPDLVPEGDKPGTNSNPSRALDDLDLMVCHQDFPNLIALADKLKKAMTTKESRPTSKENFHMNRGGIAHSSLTPTEVMDAVERMKEKHSVKNVVIRRGVYPLTDAMMDDNFNILQEELEFSQPCSWSSIQGDSHPSVQNLPSSPFGGASSSVNKFSKWQVDILMKWIVTRKHNMFPTATEALKLADETKLSEAQVLNWIKNVRTKRYKATLEGKKPHHFIDFVFMAQARDNSGTVSCKESRLWRSQTQGSWKLPHPLPIPPPVVPSPLGGSSNPRIARSRYYPGPHPTPLDDPKYWRVRPKRTHTESGEFQSTTKFLDTTTGVEKEPKDTLEPLAWDIDLDFDLLQYFARHWAVGSKAKDTARQEVVFPRGKKRRDATTLKSANRSETVCDWKELDMSPIPGRGAQAM